MSEYWKSTPKYWCKNCSTYVKDTPFERRQHESTAKHQNNLKRFLRDIQNDHERSEREKQRAKDEVERLNKLTGNSASATEPAAASTTSTIRKPVTGRLTADDQKRQWTQLAEMGIEVPDTYRGELAQASNWSVVSKRKPQEVTNEGSLSKGFRKRKLEEGEEEEQELAHPTRKAWGKSTKSYPGQDTKDLDALLSGPLPLKSERTEIKTERPDPATDDGVDKSHDDTTVGKVAEAAATETDKDTISLVKQESADKNIKLPINEATPMPVFKRRKNKAASTNAT